MSPSIHSTSIPQLSTLDPYTQKPIHLISCFHCCFIPSSSNMSFTSGQEEQSMEFTFRPSNASQVSWAAHLLENTFLYEKHGAKRVKLDTQQNNELARGSNLAKQRKEYDLKEVNL